MLNDFIQVT